MRLPKEKIVFIVDTIPVGSFPGRGMIDFYPLETEDFIKKVMAMDWDRLIPGHPGQPNDRLGTKDDAQERPRAVSGGLRRNEERWVRPASAGTRSRRSSSCRSTRAAGLRQRSADGRAALLRAVGPWHLMP